jgi:L-ascorbate metabolism protein UlaG (beta-lactamase superfamily)
MACELTWLGHACWKLSTAGTTILIDPFLNDSPVAPIKADRVDANYVLVSHGHFDHCADAAEIANRCGAMLLSNYEITTWFSSKHGVRNTMGMNLGGGVNLPFGRVELTLAFHSSQLPDGSYGGNPAGFLIRLTSGVIYFACDTGLFSDMKRIGAAGIDVAVLPIGDLFTMGPDASLEAVKLLAPRHVLPSHYNTWPPIAQDAKQWAARVSAETSAQPVVLRPGERWEWKG